MSSIVYNEDCLAAMRTFKDKQFDLAIVDPPYGLPKGSAQGAGKLKNRTLNAGNIKTWDIKPSEEYFEELFRVSANQIIWGGNYFALPPTRGIVVWDKEQPFPNFSAVEYAWTSFQSVSKIFRCAATRTGDECKIHPTQKPIRLYDFLLYHYANPGYKILDTHVGSGSSRIACYKFGADFTGYEINKTYLEQQEQRYADFIAQADLFKAMI